MYGYYNGYSAQPIYSPNVQMAVARITGGPLAPEIRGYVWFRDVPGGTEVCVDVEGLPAYQPARRNRAPVGPFGFSSEIKLQLSQVAYSQSEPWSVRLQFT